MCLAWPIVFRGPNPKKEGILLRPITIREKDVVVSFFCENAKEPLKDPLAKVAHILLRDFGLSISSGRLRARKIIDELESAGRIECEKNGRGIKAIKFIVVEKNEAEKIPTPACRETSSVLPQSRLVEGIRSRWVGTGRKHPHHKKTDSQRFREESRDKGEVNEERFYRLMVKLARVARDCAGEKLIELIFTRSGRHNPKKGKIDLNDARGEDVSGKLVVRVDGGAEFGRFFIQQVKSSQWHADQFNQQIRFYPGQEFALFKKAYVVNRYRSDAEIVGEVLEDIISSHSVFSILLPYRDKILRFFNGC